APDLEAVCLKCLEKDPGRRYRSAEALADDLGRWLDGKPTQARPLRWPATWWRAASRHPRYVAAALPLAGLAVPAMWVAFPPQPVPEQLQGELARGRPVTLLGETGKPRWQHYRVGEEDTQESAAADGAFSLRAYTTCLVELIRDPRRSRYRIRAEIRH